MTTHRTARILIGVAALAGVALAGSGEAPCPERIKIWEHEELVVEAGEWRGTVLELDADRARLREVVVRFAQPRLDEVEARWFELGPLPVEPYWAGVATRILEEEPLAEFCRELDARGLGELRTGVGNTCEDDGLVTRSVSLTSETPGFRYGLQARARPGFDRLCAGKPARRIRTEVAERQVTLEPMPEDDETAPGEGAFLRLAIDRIASLRRGLDLDTGPAAHADATRVLAELSGVRGGKAILPDLSSLRLLDAVGAGDAALEAAILEALGQAPFETYPGRLKALGDVAGERSTYDLVRIVRVAYDRMWPPQPAVLALRALHRSDPARARLEAIRFLGRPDREEVVGALGVYSLGGSDLADELNELDLADRDAVREAASRLLRHLATTGDDERLRAAARRVLEGSSGGS